MQLMWYVELSTSHGYNLLNFAIEERFLWTDITALNTTTTGVGGICDPRGHNHNMHN